MQYHPHGDASIGDAMVQIGQKELLIDCQGN
jgi:topoisomerase-4 subunit A